MTVTKVGSSSASSTSGVRDVHSVRRKSWQICDAVQAVSRAQVALLTAATHPAEEVSHEDDELARRHAVAGVQLAERPALAFVVQDVELAGALEICRLGQLVVDVDVALKVEPVVF